MARPYSSRRPRPSARRQRKAVAFYTDDNPSTFTTKYKRGEQPPPPPSHSQQHPSKSKNSTSGRRRKREEQSSASGPPKKVQPQVEIDPSLGHVLPHCVTLAPMFSTNSSLSLSSASHIRNGPSLREKVQNDPSLKAAFGRGLGTPRPPSKPTWQNIAGGQFCHAMHDSNLGSSSSTAKMTTGATARTNAGGTLTTSARNAAASSYMAQKITCMAASSCQNYLAMGDIDGLVTIYSLMSVPLPILTLCTTASAREEESEARGAMKASSKNKPLASQYENSIETLAFVGANICLSTKNEIQLIDAQENRIMWTHPIVPELGPAVKLDMDSNGWCLASFRCSINMNSNKNSSTTDAENSKTQDDDGENSKISSGEFSPCIMLRPQNDGKDKDESNEQLVQAINVLPKDKDGNIFSVGTSGAAIFDRSDSSRIIMLTQIYDRTKLSPVCTQVLLVFSIDGFQIHKQTLIPVTTKGNKFISSEALSQSGNGKFTLVASMHGIRLFDTETLELLSVYGEGISLHGDSVVWQDCFLIPHEKSNSMEEHQVSLRENTYYEHEDELRYRQCVADDSKKDASPSSFLVVGVPHAFRKPHEFQDVLHFWEVNCDGRLPMFTIRAPCDGIAKSDGIGTTLYCPSAEGAGRLLLSTQKGGCFQMLPNKKSDWPGIMYPPGYLVVNDNLEYIEEEDEYDHAIRVDDVEDQGNGIEEDERMDDDLAEAVRRSVLEQSLTLEEVDTDTDIVVVDHAAENTSLVSIPCRSDPYPENSLKEDDELVEDTSTSKLSPTKHSYIEPKNTFVASFLSLLPQKESAQDTVTESLKESEMEKSTVDELDADVKVPPVRLARGKRTGRANLEALLNASIDPKLRSFMISRENWVNGMGSTLRSNARSITNVVTPDVDTKQMAGDRCRIVGEPDSKSAVPLDACDLTGKSTEAKIINEDSSPKGVDDEIASEKEPEKISLTASSPEVESTKQNSLMRADSSEALTKAEHLNGGTVSPSEIASEGNIDGQNLNTQNSDSDATRGDLFTGKSDGGEYSVAKTPEKKMERTSRKCSNCDACWGRMVYHTCGIRELPIDYDAIARAEKEKREQEEVAKHKARAEKRRVADQKRREAKRQKKLQEEAERKREEDEIRQKQMERERREDEERRRESEDKERRRVELLQRLQEEQNEMSIEADIRHMGAEETTNVKRDKDPSVTAYTYDQQQEQSVPSNGATSYYSYNSTEPVDQFRSTTSYPTHETALPQDSSIDHANNQSSTATRDAQRPLVSDRRGSAPSAAAAALASLADVCFDASSSKTEAQPSEVVAQTGTSYSHEPTNTQQSYSHYGQHGGTESVYQQYESHDQNQHNQYVHHHQTQVGYNNSDRNEHYYGSYGQSSGYQDRGQDSSSSHWYSEHAQGERAPQQYHESANGSSSTWSYKEQPTTYQQNGAYTAQPQYSTNHHSNQYYSEVADRSASMPSSKEYPTNSGVPSEMQTSEYRPPTTASSTDN